MADGRDGTLRTLGNPVKLAETPPTLRTPPPRLGEHTDTVLAGLGYTAREVVDLHAQGVV
jgi:crotonobetainyl-CoA:carnitine CoA-transferase CaiB-like acyl-CoA transferase